ncbi:MAG: hypothetical protein MUE51_14740, partial [Thermoleophilia bacterium]|nr:hypothetical protein [Thermoleophilia bacterium]
DGPASIDAVLDLAARTGLDAPEGLDVVLAADPAEAARLRGLVTVWWSEDAHRADGREAIAPAHIAALRARVPGPRGAIAGAAGPVPGRVAA